MPTATQQKISLHNKMLGAYFVLVSLQRLEAENLHSVINQNCNGECNIKQIWKKLTNPISIIEPPEFLASREFLRRTGRQT